MADSRRGIGRGLSGQVGDVSDGEASTTLLPPPTRLTGLPGGKVPMSGRIPPLENPVSFIRSRFTYSAGTSKPTGGQYANVLTGIEIVTTG